MESLLCDSSDSSHNVGTYLYACPEVKNNSFYTEKVDMYSLGIILFEMWHPFKTYMERYKNIELLRNQKELPNKFLTEHTKQSDLILKLVDSSPEKRPSAATVLKALPSKSRSKAVRGFGAHLARVSMENNRLVEENQALLDKIKLLEGKIAKLEGDNAAKAN